MKVLLLVVVLIAQVCVSFCYVKSNYEARPHPMKHFIPEKAAGRWYYIARTISCAYQGARDFRDQSRMMEYDPEGRLYKVRHDYRIMGSKCLFLDDIRKATGDSCAVQYAQDRIGNQYSGERIVVATDYKKFMIEWGCLQYFQTDTSKCKDVMISAMARHPDPSPRVRHIIDAVLTKIFSITMKDMEFMKQEKPCPEK